MLTALNDWQTKGGIPNQRKFDALGFCSRTFGRFFGLVIKAAKGDLMRVLKLGLLSSIAMVVFGAALSTEVSGQDERLIGGGSGITVFEDRNFRGDAATYQSNVSNLPSKFNNKISSIRVGNGEQWQICDQTSYRGQCVTISGEESDLRQNNWDNRISSLRRLSGGGGGWNPGNPGAQRPPSWAQGTWYGRSTENNREIVLTINGNGSVTGNVYGSITYGTYSNGAIHIYGQSSRVSRSGSGMYTTRNDGFRTNYYRNQSDVGGPGGGGNISSPPSWARGTFYGRSPSSGKTVRLTIGSDGRITAVVDGVPAYGTYYNGSIFIYNSSSTVTRQGDGFRTVDGNSGEITIYRR